MRQGPPAHATLLTMSDQGATTGAQYRIEHDTMGEVRVPAGALYGAQTQRAVENFPISGRGLERAQIRALGLVKAAAARVNARIGVLPEDLAAAVATDVVPALEYLAAALRRRADDWAEVVKAGRTHLMDAVPITLGQEAGGWAAQARYGAERLASCLPRLSELPIGGTAVGTGLNTPAGFGAAVVEQLRRSTGLDLLTEARDHIEAQGARDSLVECSGALRTVAVSLFKIANDIRWLSSGPRTGLAELRLPDLQPGSSIMPGKVNPVISEATMMVAAQVIGNDATVAFAGAQGNFELNVMMPVMARNLLESVRLLAAVSRLLADKVVDGMEADEERAREYAESSPSVVTPLNRYIGYEEAASIAKQSLRGRKTIREVVIERGHVDNGKLTIDQLDAALDVLTMARGGRSAG